MMNERKTNHQAKVITGKTADVEKQVTILLNQKYKIFSAGVGERQAWAIMVRMEFEETGGISPASIPRVFNLSDPD